VFTQSFAPAKTLPLAVMGAARCVHTDSGHYAHQPPSHECPCQCGRTSE